MKLRPADKRAIEQHVAEFERATGVQAVVSVVSRCDGYPEAPWRAFALGAALAALYVSLVPVSGGLLFHSTVLMLVAVLGAGAGAALAAVWLPGFSRLFLPASRRDGEVRQYAQAQVLERGLFSGPERRVLLVLLGLFERRGVVILAHGLREQVTAADCRNAEALLNAALSEGRPDAAVETALAILRPWLTSPGGIPNEVIEEPGT